MDKYAEMVDRLLLGSSGDKPYGFKSHYLYLAVEDPVEDGIASSMVEYYTSDIAILVRFQCNAINLDDRGNVARVPVHQVLRTIKLDVIL